MVRLLVLLSITSAYFRPLECISGDGIDAIESGKVSEVKPLTGRFVSKIGPFKSSFLPGKTTTFNPSRLALTGSALEDWISGKSSSTSGWPTETVKFNHPIQSPVDLITSKAVTKDLPMLDIIEPELKGVQAKVYNSGHTVYVYIKEDASLRPYLIGGPLKEKYNFEQMHFHWGSEDIWGSEHFVDGESYAVEIHMVHYNSKYLKFEDAAKEDDGLAVLTIFAEAHTENNTLLDPLYNLLPKISEAKTSAILDSMDAMKWAASALSTNKEYYTYPGSLTTEPYSENVIFILLPKPITLSCTQLEAFRELHSEHEGYITDNKRQLQPLHHRPIVRSTKLQ